MVSNINIVWINNGWHICMCCDNIFQIYVVKNSLFVQFVMICGWNKIFTSKNLCMHIYVSFVEANLLTFDSILAQFVASWFLSTKLYNFLFLMKIMHFSCTMYASCHITWLSLSVSSFSKKGWNNNSFLKSNYHGQQCLL